MPFWKSRSFKWAWGILAFLCWEFPQWLSAMRSLATDKWTVAHMPQISIPTLADISVSIETVIRLLGAAMFGGLALVMWRERSQSSADGPEMMPPEPPRSGLDVEVFSGKSVVLTLKNRGRPFVLGARGRIVRSTEPIEHGAPYEYKPRELGTGETISGFTVAAIDDDLVTVYGEFNQPVQWWGIAFRPKLEFRVTYTFLKITGGHSEKVQEVTVLVTSGGAGHSHDSRRQLIATLE